MWIRSQWKAGLITVGWLGVVAGGFCFWEKYDRTPGVRQFEPGEEEEASPNRRLRIVFFAHPHCPCLRTTLGMLAEVMKKAPADVEMVVEYVRPTGVPEGWEKTDSWKQASALPGVTVHCDAGGVQARRLGATTSGHLMAFDATGKTIFSGGISTMRGRTGRSAGQQALEDLLAGRTPQTKETPVFGCPLFSSEDRLRENQEGVACPRQ
ncbi:thioredoxin domain-containing protein [Zavarzinella formosa]|uniref:hypothetical protein n=1 Tax=Zavarzinella formosa TaxID=360055 RepID=UPI0007C5A885|nr:hypothetical protein [Zavarzinella formosa]